MKRQLGLKNDSRFLPSKKQGRMRGYPVRLQVGRGSVEYLSRRNEAKDLINAKKSVTVRTDKWVDGGADGQIDSLDGWMDGRTDGQTK